MVHGVMRDGGNVCGSPIMSKGMVEGWWRDGGGMVEGWWRDGGGMVSCV